ncbi:MAG: hypothetical protein PHF00_04040 [Elusimicrobia bacterium]|nr:hypothetical protein [Elusimicrobiota bacterium]
MSKFLRRNRKKGLFALLLMLLGERKAVLPLLLVAVMLSFVFVAPENFAGNVWVRTRAAAWVGARLGLSDAAHFADLLRAFRSAQSARSLSWSEIFSRGGGADGAPASSVALVRGAAAEFGLVGGASRGQARSIRGILTPEDAGQGARGVALDEESLARALAGEALRGGRADDSALGGPAYAIRKTVGIAGAGTGVADNVKEAFDGVAVADAGSGRGIAGSPGRLSRMAAAKLSLELRRAVTRNYAASGRSAFAQLADGRARTQMAAEPACKGANGCPSEFAATNVGAVYDGNRVGASAPKIMTAPMVDGDKGVGGVPGEAQMRGFADEAQQTQDKVGRCSLAERTYSPLEQDVSTQLKQRRDNFQSSCTGGGTASCSMARYRGCLDKGREIIRLCRRFYSLQHQHCMACPLTAEEGCSDSQEECRRMEADTIRDARLYWGM